MNKYILEKYGGVIRKNFLNIKSCRFMNSLPSGAVGADDISAFKLDEFIKRNKLLPSQGTGVGSPTVLSSSACLCSCARKNLLPRTKGSGI